MGGHRYNWKWSLAELNLDKDVNVMSTFSCGGGSSMGYKRAGFHVLANVEIDPKINAMYVLNHHPKYNYCMDLRKFNELPDEDLPEELFHLDILDGSPPCFAAGAKVRTDKGYKDIENITIGDRVLTHKGRFRDVTAVMRKKSTDCYRVKIQGVLPFIVTGNHPFLVRKMTRKGHDSHREFGAPEWRAVKDLVFERPHRLVRSQDYIGIPVGEFDRVPEWDGVYSEHHIYGKSVEYDHKNTLDLSSPEVWYMIGKYIGDGWRRKDRKVVIICCAKDKRDDLEKVIRDAGYNPIFTEQRTTFRAEINNAELWEYLERFGKGAENKRLTEDILQLPDDLLKMFLDGYMSADGHYDAARDKYACNSVSFELIMGLQAAIARVYKQPTTITVRTHNSDMIEGRKVNSKVAYSLGFYQAGRRQQHGFYEDGYLWVPFRKLEKVSGEYDVYNMSVAEDESYTVFNLAVHNCSSFSSAGKRDKQWGKEKKFREGQAKQVLDDLFFVFLDTVEKLKPKVVIAENVVGLISGKAKGYVNMILKRFKDLGYEVQIFSLNAAYMDVPQARHRVFFIANRMGYPKLKLNFNYDPIPFGEVRTEHGKEATGNTVLDKLMQSATEKDRKLEHVMYRVSGKKGSFFTSLILQDADVSQTITAGGAMYRFCDKKLMSDMDFVHVQSFPEDYNFGTNEPQYVCGMSVPPNMMANIATEVYEQWLA